MAFPTPLDGNAFDFSEDYDSWVLHGGGVDLLVAGRSGDIDPRSLTLANRVAGDLEHYASKAIDLLSTYLKDDGKWTLHTVDVGAGARTNRCDVQLTFDFQKTTSRFAHTYVTFTVCFSQDGREILPSKLVVTLD